MAHRRKVDEPLNVDPVTEIALSWQPPATRRALAALFALDRRLASVISRAREPLLAQMRLAWWRDRLSEEPNARPFGEPLLGELSEQFGSHGANLAPLIDGWEHLLGEAPLERSAIEAFAFGRGQALAALARLTGAGSEAEAATSAGRQWAFAGLAWRSSNAEERALAASLAMQESYTSPRSRALRGVAVLGGLAHRALTRGEPMLHGRGAALTAMRLGLFGR